MAPSPVKKEGKKMGLRDVEMEIISRYLFFLEQHELGCPGTARVE